MTQELVSTYESNRTRSGPVTSFGKKPAKVVLVAGAIGLYSMTATASNADAHRDRARVQDGWTNSGDPIKSSTGESRSFTDAVLEVRRRSGLTWEQLASLFGVDRRSVHLWASGRPLSAQNGERLGRILAVVRGADRGTPSATKAWLSTPGPSGRTRLELLREGRFDQIDMPGSPVASPRPRPLSATAKAARAPQSPESLVEARSERVHVQKSRLIAAVPIKLSKPT